VAQDQKSGAHKGAGHRKRLRDRFLQSGLEGFHDYEVIELLLTIGTPRKDCKQAAKALMARFKTLPGVLDAAPADLCQVAGVGPVNLFGLKLVPAVSRRYLKQQLKSRSPLTHSQALFDYLNQTIRDKKRECFIAVYLDAKNRVIADDILFSGTVTASAVYPREVVKAALAHSAAAVIFAHNHPSGDPAPSPEDMAITRKLIQACGLVGVTVHEHLIIGAEGYFSFADQGHIARMKADPNVA
jgi:DNA repair protein RadC